MNAGPIPPFLLFRSFLTVVSSFVLGQLLFFAAAVTLGYLFFPQVFEGLLLPEEERLAILAEEPEKILPPWPMFFLTLVVTGVTYFGLGWLTSRFAPFAHFLHALFVACLIGVWFFQSYMSAEIPQKRAMDLMYLILLPLPILAGGSAAVRTMNAHPDDEVISPDDGPVDVDQLSSSDYDPDMIQSRGGD